MVTLPKVQLSDMKKSFVWLTSYLSHDNKANYLAAEKIMSVLDDSERCEKKEQYHFITEKLFYLLKLNAPNWFTNEPKEYDLPCLMITPERDIMILQGRSGGAYLCETEKGKTQLATLPEGAHYCSIHRSETDEHTLTAQETFKATLKSEPRWLVLAIVASAIGSIIALATSLYSMQVYDRVFGSHSYSTLIVLTAGVFIALSIDLPIKMARSNIIDNATISIDKKCANSVFLKLLNIRLDQLPDSIGTLAAQVKSYETVRGFYISLLLFLTTDGPFAIFFIVIIAFLGGPVIAAIPLVFMFLSFMVGMYYKNRIINSANDGMFASNKRQGLLVEAIEGAETRKANGGHWKLLGRWNELSAQTNSEFVAMKHMSDNSMYLSAMLQQLSYIGIIAVGAYISLSTPDLTTGTLVACSILSGRALSPVSIIPGLLVQWANAKTSLRSLESIYKLGSENDAERSIYLHAIRGDISMSNLELSYQGQSTKLKIDNISISAGEKVAILGPVGVGKSTLLKAMGGLIKPAQGQVLVDGIDILQISSERRNELLGFMPQKLTFFSGTLKENLLTGLPIIAEDNIIAAARKTGLINLINSRSDGLNMKIYEGGGGLSQGQKQLVGITRLLLMKPNVWFLDEPTSSMDIPTESHCLNALQSTIRPEDTLILVTHKPSNLVLVDRIIVLTHQGVVLDGNKKEVMDRLFTSQV